MNAGLGLIDTNYIQAGVFNGVTGNFPGAPFAYAPDQSGTIGAQYDIPLGSGGHILLVGNAGYMGEYSRDAAYQRTQIDPVTLQPILEPAYTILNTRFVYEPAALRLHWTTDRNPKRRSLALGHVVQLERPWALAVRSALTRAMPAWLDRIPVEQIFRYDADAA